MMLGHRLPKSHSIDERRWTIVSEAAVPATTRSEAHMNVCSLRGEGAWRSQMQSRQLRGGHFACRGG